MEPEIRYRVYNSPPLIPILRQINPVHYLTPLSFVIDYALIGYYHPI
jgi:hypothetical protein